MLYHVEFKSMIDGCWHGARVGHSMTKDEAETAVDILKATYPNGEYRVSPGAYPHFSRQN
jgi:hypothetical protein